MTTNAADWFGLLDECRKQNDVACGKLFTEIYLGAKTRVQRQFRLSAEAAEDIAQDTAARCFEYLERLKGRTHREIVGWVMTTADRFAVGVYWEHRHRLAAEMELRAGGEEPGASVLGSPHYPRFDHSTEEIAVSIHRFYEKLEPVNQELLYLRLVKLLSWEEVGAELGLTPEAAKRRLQRALGTLKRELTVFSEAGSQDAERLRAYLRRRGLLGDDTLNGETSLE